MFFSSFGKRGILSFSKLLSRNPKKSILLTLLALISIYTTAKKTLTRGKKVHANEDNKDQKETFNKIGVNLNFLRQLKKMILICVPGIF